MSPWEADFDKLLEECPGAVGGVSPAVGIFGFIDVNQPLRYDAMVYLNQRGVKYLREERSPVPDCVRLRFKFGMTTGLVQEVQKNAPIEDQRAVAARAYEGWLQRERERAKNPGLSRRLGRWIGRKRRK